MKVHKQRPGAERSLCGFDNVPLTPFDRLVTCGSCFKLLDRVTRYSFDDTHSMAHRMTSQLLCYMQGLADAPDRDRLANDAFVRYVHTLAELDPPQAKVERVLQVVDTGRRKVHFQTHRCIVEQLRDAGLEIG